MCASEGSPIIRKYRCAAYEKLHALCLAFAARNRIRDWSFNWRQSSNCRKYLYHFFSNSPKIYFTQLLIAANCAQNEVFSTRNECPRTCLDPLGRKFCGVRAPREGCYCRDGFVRNSAGRCVKLEECGCKLPHNRGLVAVGQTIVSRDCSKRFTCAGPQQGVRVETLRKCSPNAQCRGDSNRVPRCYCNSGFIGDGYTCKLKEGATTKPLNPCQNQGVCGRGAECRVLNQKAVCFCKNKLYPDRQTCCKREFRTL